MKFLTNIPGISVGDFAWTKGKIVGHPQPTIPYSIEFLERVGLVGIYQPEGSDQGYDLLN